MVAFFFKKTAEVEEEGEKKEEEKEVVVKERGVDSREKGSEGQLKPRVSFCGRICNFKAF